MTYKRIDDNQKKIVDELRQFGASVQSLASVGDGCPDLLIGFGGVNYLMEVKDGNKTASQRKLTKKQEEFFADWDGSVFVVKNTKEALEVLRQKKKEGKMLKLSEIIMG